MAKHLTLTERQVLRRLLQAGNTKAHIARLIGRHRATIGREINRNSGKRGYQPRQAQRLAQARRQKCRRLFKLANPRLREYVRKMLRDTWSPDQIAGRCRRRLARWPRRMVSRQTIYNWINHRARGWRKWLRRGGKPPETRGKRTDLVRITGRPNVINYRRRFGDWEGDTLVGKGRRSGLLTMVERKSGFTRIGRLNDMRAATTTRVACRRMQPLPERLRRSVTFDNGKEFMEHRELSRRLKASIYFTQPYRSWQRGTNENTNGLLRQFFPKGTDFTRISHRAVARVEQKLNGRPRRRLGYRTPAEVLAKRLVAVDY